MRRFHLDLIAGSALLLGPLVYALTLEPTVVEVAAPPAVDAPIVAPDLPTVPATTPRSPRSAPVFDDAPIRFAFVSSTGVVLTTHADPAWGQGPLRDHRGPGQFSAARAANLDTIPPSLRAQSGRQFDLYGAAGALCTVQLGALSVVASHNGPSLRRFLSEEPSAIPNDFDLAAITPHDVRHRLWSRATEGSVALIAEFVDDGTCQGALWATDAELEPPTVLHPAHEPTSDITRATLARFGRSPDRAKARRTFRRWLRPDEARSGGQFATWNALVHKHPATVTEWRDTQDTTQLVALEFGANGGSCTEWFNSAVHWMELRVDDRFVPRPYAADPVAVFDLDHDGQFERLYITQDSTIPNWLDSESEDLKTMWTIEKAFDCGC